MKIGSTNISKIYIGNNQISKAYLGSTLVFEQTPNDLYNLMNCARRVPNEVDATTGFSVYRGSGSIQSSNTGATATNGAKFLKFTHTGANNTELDIAAYLTGLELGETYKITFDVNRIARPSGNGTAEINVYSDTLEDYLTTAITLPTSAGWSSQEMTFTVDDVDGISFGGYFYSNADPGDTIGIDNVIIVKL